TKEILQQNGIPGHIFEKLGKVLCYIFNEKRITFIILTKIFVGICIIGLKVFSTIIIKIYSELNYNTPETFTVCNDVYSPVDEDIFKMNKVLFDYSKDYEKIKHHIRESNTTCDEKYKGVLENYIDTYSRAYSTCNGTQRTEYDCKYFDKLFPKNDELTKFISLECSESQNQSVSLQEQRPTIQGHASTVYFPQTAAGNENLGMNRHSGFQQDKDTIELISADDTAGGSSSKTIIGSAVPVLGVSFISFLLYRFTPAGGFINKLLGRNRNMYNPIEDIDGFNPYKEGMVDGRRRVNISYHNL
ncbi:CYIR protein, partial [Plasmodium cynomolgi strain B]